MPATIYNIDSTNNLITFDDGIPRTATLSSGQYTASALATQVGTKMTSGGGQTYTCTYDSTAMKFTISAAGAFTLFFNSARSPYFALGFNFAATSTATSQTSLNVVSLEQPTMINVSILEFNDSLFCGTTGTTSTSSSTTATAVGNLQSSFLIRLKETSSSLNVKEFEADELTGILKLSKPISFSKLHIQLKDLNDNLISLNGADWVAYLYVYHEAPYPHIGFENWNCPCCRDDKTKQNKKRCNTCMSK